MPNEIPYLAIEPARVAAWRERYTKASQPGVPKVGLVFHANPASASVSDRSLKPADVARLLAINGVDWVNLQGGEAGRELAANHPGVIDVNPEMPLDEFAAAVAATDLLVTVDTMAPHCAGALGHPVWIMVPHCPHWAWGIGSDHTPWYPTGRLFRQSAPRDWSAVIETIVEKLAAFAHTRIRPL